MYFKSLQLVGFKSFAEKTLIGFEPGITAIVGPNGCGKSNVSDAIRWVLGEQNARNLRGSLMEDLIFGGSSHMEPMGMAEVSLTLGDARGLTEEQYDELTVSRRLFRSGESQYFLNKRPCRLRDIHKVFMDTGMGTQAYSFIQQGNIDLILSSKPEDRRYLFDETAGISHYKANKKVAVRKMEAAEANLARLSDLLREVKRQIISIQRQAGKARRYKELAEELQALEVGFLLYKRGCLSEKMNSVQGKRESLHTILSGIRREVEEREVRIRDIRAELRSSELTHEELQARRLDILRNIDRESGKVSLFEQRIADTRALSENAAAEIKKMRQKTADLESAIREKQERVGSLSQQRLSFDQKLKDNEERLNESLAELRRTEGHSTELSNRLLDLIRREMELRSRLSSITETMEGNRQLLVELEKERQEVRSSIQQKERSRRDAQTENRKFSEQLSRQKEALAGLREKIKKTEEERNNLRREMLGAESALSRVATERRFLAEAVEQYEGYDAGVRSVIQESKRQDSHLHGIFGTVANVIEVSPGFEECVEAALEHRLQWVLTDTLEDARTATGHLQEKSCGRATFLPLDKIEGCNGARHAVRKLCHKKGTDWRSILEVVSFDPRYEKVMDYLLGSIVICPDWVQALEVARENHCDLTFVAPSGEKVEDGFALTAGNGSSAAPSLVSRKSRLASLMTEEVTQGRRVNDLREREQRLVQTQETLSQETERQMVLISESEGHVAEVERHLLDLSTSIEFQRQRAGELAQRLAQTESEQNRLDLQRQTFSKELGTIDEERSQVETAIAANRESTERTQRSVASLKKDLAEIALAKASYDERIGNLQNDIEYLRGQLDLTKKDVESRARQVEEGDVHIREFETEVQECRTAIVSLNQEKETVSGAIEELDEKRKLLVDDLSQTEWEMKEKGSSAREREKEVSELDIKLAEMRFSINGIDEHLVNEYGLSYDDPKATPMSEVNDLEGVQRGIAEMKRRLHAMGPVNLCALEEHESLQKRYEFLTSQQADLLEAKDSLLKAIARLDRESKALFREAFERIREEFREMFKRLFGGGRADLVLVDESDILESGIEIIARPPGKKLQTISLLSGGERAMTAISLLFAIFKVKPSPFCLLDEIDAPLDDSNILRFSEILQEFAQRSQFIIITHNKRTIATSDVLYGITMEESGKSKVVSARLTRRKEEASAPRAAEASSAISHGKVASAAAAAN